MEGSSISPKLSPACKRLGKLLEKKNASYGDSWKTVGEALGIFYPEGIPVHAYSDVMLLVRMFDKVARLANGHRTGNPDEESPWRDIAGYGVIGLVSSDDYEGKNNRDTL